MIKRLPIYWDIPMLGILAIGLRLPWMLSNEIALDEPFSIFHAMLSPGQIIETLNQGNNPPGYELILHGWMKITGTSVVAIRALSLIFGVLSVLFMYKAFSVFAGRRAGWIAALFTVFSTYHIYFSLEARGYVLLFMLASISFWVIAKIRAQTIKPKIGFFTLAVVNVLMCYTHYMAVVLLLSQLFWLRPWGKNAKWWMISAFLTVILFIPQLQVFVERSGDVTTKGTWLGSVSVESIWIDFAKFMNSPVSGVVTLLFMVFSIMIVMRTKHNQNAIWGIVGFLIPLIFMFIISPVVNLFLDRYLFVLTIPLYGGLALLSENLLTYDKKWIWIPSIALILVFLASVKPGKSNERAQAQMITEVHETRAKNSVIVITPYWHIYNFAWHMGIRSHPADFPKYMSDQGFWFIGVLSEDDLSNLPEHVILMEGADVEHSDPNHESARILATQFVWKGSRDYPHWKVHYFAKE